jgi:hypothetical protein
MGGDEPMIADWVGHTRAAVSVELVRWLHQGSTTCLECPLVGRVCVIDVQVNGAGHRLVLAPCFAHHDGRVANPNLGMHDGTVRRWHPHDLLRLENLLQEIEQFGHFPND